MSQNQSEWVGHILKVPHITVCQVKACFPIQTEVKNREYLRARYRGGRPECTGDECSTSSGK